MSKIWMVFKQEIIRIVWRRSFIIALILVPLIGGGVYLIASSVMKSNEIESVETLFQPPEEPELFGYIDESGLLVELPDEIADRLLPFDTVAEAEAAVSGGDIAGYYIIPADYVLTGKLQAFRPDFNPMAGLTRSEDIIAALNYNIIGRDPALFARITSPIVLTSEYLDPTASRHADNEAAAFFVPYAIMMFMYVLIMGTATMMLTSVTQEKENRLIEVLMNSMRPVEMLTGKILALGLVGLSQTILWLGLGWLALQFSPQAFNLPASIRLPIEVILWSLPFFILGFAVYASLMAGVGALAPNMRETGAATTIFVMPLVVPMVMINAMVADPNGVLATILSLIPLTAPVAMMTRIAAATVPLWQILLSLGLLVVTAWLIVRGVAGMFRAQVLLSGQKFKIGTFFKAFFGKA
ncbi:MAG TPA: ABC transporter permease [Anaerolineaceae bacterium]|jgi:ABC-2 type transport system permease protein|nr:ABC transporter permease [Anaerolineaceae bacterium]